MKQNIEILLGEWGYWKRGENRSALGYPDSSSFHKMRVDGQRRSDPDAMLVDDDLRQLDRHIFKLYPEVRVVIIAHYVWAGPVKAKLERVQLSRTAYYANLDFAHKQLSHAMGGEYEPNVPTILSGHLAQLSG